MKKCNETVSSHATRPQGAPHLENCLWYLYLQLPLSMRFLRQNPPSEKRQACLFAPDMVYLCCRTSGLDGSTATGPLLSATRGVPASSRIRASPSSGGILARKQVMTEAGAPATNAGSALPASPAWPVGDPAHRALAPPSRGFSARRARL